MGKGNREMTPEERELLHYLCSRIQEEKDPITYDGLVRELRDLLEQVKREPRNVRSQSDDRSR